MSPSQKNNCGDVLLQSKDELDLLKNEESTVIQEYMSKFGEEEQLNKQFQEHVNRCRKEYTRDIKKGLLHSF